MVAFVKRSFYRGDGTFILVHYLCTRPNAIRLKLASSTEASRSHNFSPNQNGLPVIADQAGTKPSSRTCPDVHLNRTRQEYYNGAPVEAGTLSISADTTNTSRKELSVT